MWLRLLAFPAAVLAGIGTVGVALGAFVLLLAQLFDPVQQLSQLYNTMQSAGAALKKLFGILDAQPEIDEKPGAVDLPESGDLVVDGVTFTYQGGAQPAIDAVSLTLVAGKRLALVGPTGAGKSTLAQHIIAQAQHAGGMAAYIDVEHALAELRKRELAGKQG